MPFIHAVLYFPSAYGNGVIGQDERAGKGINYWDRAPIWDTSKDKASKMWCGERGIIKYFNL